MCAREGDLKSEDGLENHQDDDRLYSHEPDATRDAPSRARLIRIGVTHVIADHVYDNRNVAQQGDPLVGGRLDEADQQEDAIATEITDESGARPGAPAEQAG